MDASLRLGWICGIHACVSLLIVQYAYFLKETLFVSEFPIALYATYNFSKKEYFDNVETKLPFSFSFSVLSHSLFPLPLSQIRSIN